MKPVRSALVAALALALPGSAGATTKGLNQIVTPDIQPAGVLSISPQYQHPQVGNSKEVQLELGLTKRFEIAVFQGFSPSEQIVGAEAGLVQNGPYLLSAGFINLSNRTHKAQPFLEGGYYKGKNHFIVGVIRVKPQYQAILGIARQVTQQLQISADYQGGGANFKTVGFTYNFTPNLSLNPALYFTNVRPSRTYPYVVLTYNIPLWKTPAAEQNPTPSTTPPKNRTNQNASSGDVR